MKKTIKKFDKKKFLNIISYVGIGVFFLFALICAIAKFNGARFAFFGRRYDVVLTNSMSEKNEVHKDFLEGHDDQFKAFDLAVSRKIKSPEDLHVYDVVIYKDRSIGTNMHRIVGIEEEGHDEIRYKDGIKTSLSFHEGICLPNVTSEVIFSDIAFQEMELKVYTEIPDKESHYNFSIINEGYPADITYENSGSGMIVTYKVNKANYGIGLMHISHSKYFDFSKEVILSVKVRTTHAEINSTSENIESNGEDLLGIYNATYRYEIRGDKAAVSDGCYYFDEIEAKVIRNIKNGGYLIRFLNSLWGAIMFISLGFLILGTQFLRSRLEKKEVLAAALNSNKSENADDQTEKKDVKTKPSKTKNSKKPKGENK